MAAATDDRHRQPVRTLDDLCIPFFHAIKPVHEHRIGAEAEKFGVDQHTGAALPYEGDRSVLAVLEALVERHGWHPEAESAGGPLIALMRSGASVTLEPGGQLELSGAPLDNVHLICTEMSGHLAELRDISEELGIVWLGVGFHPFARQEDLTWVPKSRYKIMREYLPRQGAYGLDMMRRTATVQANFDYESEDDAMTKMRVALKLAPLTTALFANSPFYEGQPFGGKSYRAKVWLDTDPDRSGLVPPVWKRNAKFVDYVEWALDVPMFMFKRDGKKIANTGQSFRSFFKSGFQGYRPTMGDWQTHLNTLFPEVRLKKTIEVRGADAQGKDMACALPALFTGILYDKKALSEADAMTADWTFDEVERSRKDVWQKGLAARFRAGTLQPFAEKLIDIAKSGLERRAYLSPSGKDERVHLARLEELVSKGHSPADVLLDGITYVRDMRSEILARTDLGRGH